MAINPNGVAILATFSTVLSIIDGTGICISDQISPARIPKIMGFVMMPFPVLRKELLVQGFPFRLENS